MSRSVLASLLLLAGLGAALPAAAATVLVDDFSNAGSGWPNMAATRDSDLGFAVYTDSGQYQLTPVKDDVFGFISAPKQAAGGDVSIESDLFLYAGIGAGAAGLGCRHQDHANFYAFMVRGDAVLMILKVRHGEITSLAQGRIDALMPGTVDTRLSVECKGDTLRFGARGAKTITARDGEFAEGGSGVFVIGEKMAGTSVMFDNFELSTLGAR